MDGDYAQSGENISNLSIYQLHIYSALVSLFQVKKVI